MFLGLLFLIAVGGGDFSIEAILGRRTEAHETGRSR
jgi:hypothetical protein